MMAFTGVYLTIAYTVLLHFTIDRLILIEMNFSTAYGRYVYFTIQGLIFILYPVIGLIADMKFTRYRMISCSFWIIFIVHLLSLLATSIAVIIFGDYCEYLTDTELLIINVIIFSILLLVVCGKGMFESTAIQFGIDQMIEASSDQLSTFIHWYYWSLHVGPAFVHIIVAVSMYCYSKLYSCYVEMECWKIHGTKEIAIVATIIITLQCILCLVMLPLLYLKKFKNYLNIEPAGANPLKQIIDVLKFAYKHKYPVNRSALTYYRNTYLSRIDFGKVQYGGPFTNDQVESTKTVFRLSILMLSLIGFNLIRDGFSISGHIMKKTCPSSMVLYIFISNPLLISNIITTLAIPTFHFIKKTSISKYFPNMLKRMWLGLFLLFIQEILSITIDTQIEHSSCNGTLNQHSHFEMCLGHLTEYKNITEFNTTECVYLCQSPLPHSMDNKLVWLLIPQVLHGFGYMLVFMTALEFICAQAPYTLKGFMIGMWYSMLSIKYILVGNIDIAMQNTEDISWIVYESIKIGLVGLSLIIFGIVCRWYRYRERNEVVNVQGMIEDIFENELLQQKNEDSSDNEDSITTYHTFN